MRQAFFGPVRNPKLVELAYAANPARGILDVSGGPHVALCKNWKSLDAINLDRVLIEKSCILKRISG
jgi:hypothetical protein